MYLGMEDLYQPESSYYYQGLLIPTGDLIFIVVGFFSFLLLVSPHSYGCSKRGGHCRTRSSGNVQQEGEGLQFSFKLSKTNLLLGLNHED